MKSILFILLWGSSFNSFAAEETIPLLTIKDHQFTPSTLKVKAGERFKIKVKNDDATSEEFESKTIIVEKFIAPKQTITLTLGPLKAGEYEFFGDLHPATAKGRLTAE